MIGRGGHISVQVLNEFASVANRKLKLSHAEVREILTPIRMVCEVHAMTTDTHDLGIQLA